MTPIEIAISVIGFIREALGLVTYHNIIKHIFMTQVNDLKIYLDCLNLFKKCFQIQVEAKNINSNINSSVKNNLVINNKNSLIKIDYTRLTNINSLSNRYNNKNTLLKAEEK